MEIVISINTKLQIIYTVSTRRRSTEKSGKRNVFAEQARGSQCGFLVTVHDLIWPEGGLCELEEERSLWRTPSVGGGKALAHQAP